MLYTLPVLSYFFSLYSFILPLRIADIESKFCLFSGFAMRAWQTVSVLSFFFFIFYQKYYFYSLNHHLCVRLAIPIGVICTNRNFIDVIWINSPFWTDSQFRYRCRHTKSIHKHKHPKRINIIIDKFYQQNLIYFMILMPMWHIYFLFHFIHSFRFLYENNWERHKHSMPLSPFNRTARMVNWTNLFLFENIFKMSSGKCFWMQFQKDYKQKLAHSMKFGWDRICRLATNFLELSNWVVVTGLEKYFFSEPSNF